jgi:tRNA(adenine34) deaminase
MQSTPLQAFSGFSAEDEYWMSQALAQAKLAEAQGEVPVGAVIVHQGQLLGQGYNCPITRHDPTAHAEIQAIRDACQRLANYRLPDGASLYVTLEPCTQCVGALIHARISKLIFATTEPRAGALVSARQLLSDGFYNHYFEFSGGCLAEPAKQLLQQFFKQRRQTK